MTLECAVVSGSCLTITVNAINYYNHHLLLFWLALRLLPVIISFIYYYFGQHQDYYQYHLCDLLLLVIELKFITNCHFCHLVLLVIELTISVICNYWLSNSILLLIISVFYDYSLLVILFVIYYNMVLIQLFFDVNSTQSVKVVVAHFRFTASLRFYWFMTVAICVCSSLAVS